MTAYSSNKSAVPGLTKALMVTLLWFGLSSYLGRMDLQSVVPSLNQSDATENIVNGYYVATSKVAFRDFASNHLPGVYLVLALADRAFQLDKIVPSQGLAVRAHKTARFTTGGFQIAAYGLALALVGVPFWLGMIMGAGASIYTHSLWNSLVPLTESYHLALFVSWPILIARAFCGSDGTTRLQAAWVLAAIHSGLSIWLGLTSAPTSALAILVFVGCLVRDRSSLSKWMQRDRKLIVGSLALVIMLLLSVLFTSDLSQLYFYNLPFNQSLHVDTISSLKTAWAYALMWPPRPDGLSGRVLFQGLVLSTLWCVVRIITSSRSQVTMSQRLVAIATSIIAALIMFGGVWLAFWRVPEGLKSIAAVGIDAGIVVMLLAIFLKPLVLRMRKAISVPKSVKSIWIPRLAVVAAAVVCLISMADFHHIIYPLRVKAGQPEGFDQANVCTYRQAGGCRCLRLAYWDPGFYLENDVRQCSGWGTFCPLVPSNAITLSQLQNDSSDGGVAFLLTDQSVMDMFSFPKDLVEKLKRERQCREIKHILGRTVC